MGILTINENTEFVDTIGRKLNVELTGGKYFVGQFRNRELLLKTINELPVPTDRDKFKQEITDIITRIVGYEPLHVMYYAFKDQTIKEGWHLTFAMPQESTISKNKEITLIIRFPK